MNENLYKEGEVLQSRFRDLVVLVTADQQEDNAKFSGVVVKASHAYPVNHEDDTWVGSCFTRDISCELDLEGLERIFNRALDHLEYKL